MPAICEHCHGTGQKINHAQVGQEYRNRRVEAKVGLRTLARKVKVCPAFLSRLERGQAIWKPELMKKIDSVLA